MAKLCVSVRTIGVMALMSILIVSAVIFVPAHAAQGSDIPIAAGDVQGLIAAINQANAKPTGPYTIDLAANAIYVVTAVDHSPIYLNGVKDRGPQSGANGLPVVTAAITINGNGATIERQSSAQFRLFQVFVLGNLTLNDLTLTGGDVGSGSAGQSGGALDVFPGSTATLNNVTITNSAANSGGAVRNLGTLTITASHLSGNSAAFSGGGLFVQTTFTSTVVTDSEISGNQAQFNGGGIDVFGGSLTVHNSQIDRNAAPEGGGAEVDKGGMLTIEGGSAVAGNRSTSTPVGAANVYGGGGLYDYGGTLNVTDSLIVDNVSGFAGGGIITRQGAFSIANSALLRNSALEGAGLLMLSPATGAGAAQNTISQSCIVDNHDLDQKGKVVASDGVGGEVAAANNWWGDPSGPSHSAPGKGDGVYGKVSFSPVLAAPPAICSSSTPTPIAVAPVPGTATAQPDCRANTDPSFQIQVPKSIPASIAIQCEFGNNVLSIVAYDTNHRPLTRFSAPINVCLQGSGTLSFIGIGSIQLTALKTTTANGYTCASITTPGILTFTGSS